MIVTDNCADEQLFLSETVTTYTPADKLLISSVIALNGLPSFVQVYLYGAVPPVVLMSIPPVVVPKHLISVLLARLNDGFPLIITLIAFFGPIQEPETASAT